MERKRRSFYCWSIYSMLFHTLMIYMGILSLFKLKIKLEKSRFKKFAKLYCFFAVIAIFLNYFYVSNLMLLRSQLKFQYLFYISYLLQRHYYIILKRVGDLHLQLLLLQKYWILSPFYKFKVINIIIT